MSPDELLRDPRGEAAYFRRRQKIAYDALAPFEDHEEPASHAARYVSSFTIAAGELLARRGTFGPDAARYQVDRDVANAAEDDERLRIQSLRWAERRAERARERERSAIVRLEREATRAEHVLRRKGIGR